MPRARLWHIACGLFQSTTVPTASIQSSRAGDAERVIALARELVRELRPDVDHARVDLGSHVERDLSLDSLARVELVSRAARAFGVELGDDVSFEIEHLADLLSALRAAPRAREEPLAVPETRGDRSGVSRRPAPRAETLIEALERHARDAPDRAHVIVSDGGRERALTFGELRRRARRCAAGLHAQGVREGDRVALMLPTSDAFFVAFLGALDAGAVPVPIYPPARRAQIEDHVRRQARILNDARASILVTTAEMGEIAPLLSAHVSTSPAVRTVERLEASAEKLTGRADPEALALLQYTSGSTGDPKGVALTHANLVANVRAMSAAVDASAADVMVSWLPLYHDMGLIGMWLGALYLGARSVILSPLAFLARPERWLRAIHRHRGTLSAAPNFAFELVLRRVRDEDLAGLDLSSLRFLANGAEPVRASTLRRFLDRLVPCGLRPGALAPVYGLAECAVGLAFTPLGRGMLVDRIDRDVLARSGRALPSEMPRAVEVVSCGPPLRGHAARVVDREGRALLEREQGEVEVRGPSCTSGYFGDAERTRALFDGEWLRTGDLGYLAGGELFLTGRIKDVVIRRGRLIHPHEVEDAVGELPGVRKGCVAVFGSADPESGTERLVVVAETREKRAEARAAIRRRVEEAATALLEEPPDEVVLAPVHAVQKTSSGKLRRTETRRRYERGELGRRRSFVLQLLRLGASAIGARARRWMSRASQLAYAARFWIVLVAVGVVTWPLVVLSPGLEPRWRIFREAARACLRGWGCAPRVAGVLRDRAQVYVSNHDSYVDGLVLAALLPNTPAFVAKRELAAQKVAGTFLRKLGAIFVERFDPKRSAADARQAQALAFSGRSLVYFSEGTTDHGPGLGPFRMGAFLAAARSGLPVVPIALRGTGVLLPSGRWAPRRARIEVAVGPPLSAGGTDFRAAIVLRDRTREWIAAATGDA